MKIRIRDNTIRLRLERAEVDRLRDKGVVSSHTGFPGGRRFTYSVECRPASVNPTALFSDDTITVRLPETIVLAWATTEQVSIGGEQVLDDGETLNFLVEKDFACLAPREGEDESDMFAHPDKGSVNC